ncbi:TetR/AcrR family transcriptional regulator [Alginatibacterium sediminis]|nr:TetR/AcrR family transcriptional regulator [Alginatibacterium sediminis]
MSPDKTRLILDATEEVIAQQGIMNTSMSKVAKHAGVAAGTIYLHFTDKSELISKLRERNIRDFSLVLLAGHDATLSFQQQFENLWANSYNFHLRYPEKVKLREMMRLLPDYESSWQQFMDLFTPLTEFFGQGVAQGVLKPLPGPILYSLGFGPIGEFSHQSTNQGLVMSQELQKLAVLACWDAIALNPSISISE